MKDNSELIGSLEKQLTYCARLFTGDFDDLMQVGRLALLRALSTWREESAFWTFARLHVLSDMKRFVLAERKKSFVGETNNTEEEIPDQSASAERELETAELFSLLDFAVLTPAQSEALRDRVLGVTVRETARRMGVSKSSVEEQYQAALEVLREQVKEAA